MKNMHKHTYVCTHTHARVHSAKAKAKAKRTNTKQNHHYIKYNCNIRNYPKPHLFIYLFVLPSCWLLSLWLIMPLKFQVPNALTFTLYNSLVEYIYIRLNHLNEIPNSLQLIWLNHFIFISFSNQSNWRDEKQKIFNFIYG